MRFEFIYPSELHSEIPATLRCLEELDENLLSDGFELRITDPDTWDKALEVSIDPPDKEIEEEIIRILSGQCCRCGCSENVKSLGEDILSLNLCSNIFCGRCREILSIAMELYRSPQNYLTRVLRLRKSEPEFPIGIATVKIKDKNNSIRVIEAESLTLNRKSEPEIETKSFITPIHRFLKVNILGVETELIDSECGKTIYTGDELNVITHDGREIHGIVGTSFSFFGLSKALIVSLTEKGDLPGMKNGRVASVCCVLICGETDRHYPLIMARQIRLAQCPNIT